MRGKRSKAYRKLLKQYALAFNFREPWQVLVDADLIKDAHRFAIDLPQYLSNTLHGEVKILITQCSMRHLYAQNKDGSLERIIDKAKGFERRRCGHHPEQYPEPLSTAECLASVVGPTNKHRYVVASQEQEVRAQFRRIAGVPLVYISRSVMILEPMAHATAKIVQKGERSKFRAEFRDPAAKTGEKRKRDDDDSEGSDEEDGVEKKSEAEKKKRKKRKGEKGPNPLAVRKPKKQPQEQKPVRPKEVTKVEEPSEDQPTKKKRKRKSKKTEGDKAETQQAMDVDADE
ncbi:hypothetical protein N0V93_003358 [Gnomoniopsis smithogilvyi]|uniref:U three protein 23 n=1 Tax=Gnomoniopsis smithogilvyi TaxID=1191159 RepID=A0A9W8YYI1_9PEZI|nr:hypothetical protein N0V93_003358 [Gnomoniopsis smithogilvyi]